MATAENSPVVACTLSARNLAAQAARWLQLRGNAQRSRVETDDGLRVTFDDTPAVETELEALVAVERECCSWASWDISREGSELVMEATSTANGVEALHGMFR
jgi:hypothetical protein